MLKNKASRYALTAALEMAAAADGRQVTVREVALRFAIPEAVLAKVFQQLVRAGIAVSTRGTRGGYRLATPATGLTVLDVVRVFEPAHSEGATAHAGVSLDRRLARLFDEIDEVVQCTYASVTLETLARARPAAESDRSIGIDIHPGTGS